jgi:4-amino-4-deoxy-L-arabinose transferase-like glycosyltransferase
MAPEITKTEDKTRILAGRILWAILAVLAVCAYFIGLNIPFVGPDEPRYAEVAREMLERGDWITPTLGGHNWFEKPPLLYWLEMVSYKLFGISELSARLGPVLCGLGTIASLWFLGRVASAYSNIKSDWLAIVAASTLGIVVFSHGASCDIVITFAITASLVSFLIWHLRNETLDDESRPNGILLPLVLFYFFIGVGLLAKGLIGFMPLAIVAVFYLFSRRVPSRTFLMSLIWGILLAITIASVWYVPMYQRHGYQFVDEFFVQQHFQRFTSNKYQHPQAFYFYLWVLPLMMLPWLPFFLASIWHFARQKMFGNSNKLVRLSASFLRFSLAWFLVPLVFFSLSGSKLPGYILPAVPGAIMVAAPFMSDSMRDSAKWRALILSIAAMTFGTTISLLIFTAPRYAEAQSVKQLIETAKENTYVANRVRTFQTTSYSAEFYAAGRLVRDPDGKQRELANVAELIDEITVDGRGPALVLVPVSSLSQLTECEKLNTSVIGDNGHLSLAAVSLR